jgi:hypothetical protein
MLRWFEAMLHGSQTRFLKTGTAGWLALCSTRPMDETHTAAWPLTICLNPACEVHEKSPIQRGVSFSSCPFIL